MTLVDIKITAWYKIDGKFVYYNYDCGIGAPIESDSEDFLSGHSGDERKLKSIAQNVLYDIFDEELENPNYVIRFWEGCRPLNTAKGMSSPIYTKTPKESVKKRLNDWLNNDDLISRAKEEVKFWKENPPKITILPPDGPNN